MKCMVCNEHTDSVDPPAGWYIVYAYNNDDGNNTTPYEVCSRQCLWVGSWKQAEEIKNSVNTKTDTKIG